MSSGLQLVPEAQESEVLKGILFQLKNKGKSLPRGGVLCRVYTPDLGSDGARSWGSGGGVLVKGWGMASDGSPRQMA